MRWSPPRLPDLTGRVAVVTGANSGIGWHTADALAAHGARVVLACRDLVRGEQAARRIRSRHDADVSAQELDLASMSSVREFAESWDGPLNLLVNNAGVLAPPKRRLTADGFELQFGTNHLGHFVLTGLLLRAMLAASPARVVTVASLTHHGGGDDVIDANAGPYHPHHAYANSKLANLLFAHELDRQARARRLALASVAAHPGIAATALAADTEGMGASRTVRVAARVGLPLFVQSARSGARAVLFAATHAPMGSYTGPQRFGETRGRLGPATRSDLAQDERLAQYLWRASEDLTGFHFPWP